MIGYVLILGWLDSSKQDVHSLFSSLSFSDVGHGPHLRQAGITLRYTMRQALPAYLIVAGSRHGSGTANDVTHTLVNPSGTLTNGSALSRNAKKEMYDEHHAEYADIINLCNATSISG